MSIVGEWENPPIVILQEINIVCMYMTHSMQLVFGIKNTRAINMYFPVIKLGGLVPN